MMPRVINFLQSLCASNKNFGNDGYEIGLLSGRYSFCGKSLTSFTIDRTECFEGSDGYPDARSYSVIYCTRTTKDGEFLCTGDALLRGEKEEKYFDVAKGFVKPWVATFVVNKEENR